ncbi:MAG: hypothetical protein KDC33_08375 [Thermoleophilia bacterium]|nr:hypothetical protein [Thermoleophilia bacterium]
MDFANMTMTQKKMLGGAAACLLFIISLWMPWFGEGDFSVNAWEKGSLVPSTWIWLIFALAAGGILVMGALDREIPLPIPPFATAFYLISIPFFVTVAMLLDGDYPGKKIGLFIGLIASGAAAVLAMMVGREAEG